MLPLSASLQVASNHPVLHSIATFLMQGTPEAPAFIPRYVTVPGSLKLHKSQLFFTAQLPDKVLDLYLNLFFKGEIVSMDRIIDAKDHISHQEAWQLAEVMSYILAEYDPESTTLYQKNLQSFYQKLKSIDWEANPQFTPASLQVALNQ